MSDIQTNEVPTPAVAVENPVAAAPVVAVENPVLPNVIAPAVSVSSTTAGAAPSAETEVATILKSELAHVFDAFEHFSLMEGISRLYALAKKHL
jgi:hypothetical protein